MSYKKVIAIDGPAGSGKSTVAKELAKRLGFKYVDTGAIYRSIAYYCIKNNIDLESEEEILRNIDKIKLEFKTQDNNDLRVFLNGEDITNQIRSEEMGKYAAVVAKHGKLRRALVDFQRGFANNGWIIMDGRDIGTVIFPDAYLKIYLDASVEERARRRLKQLEMMGIKTTYEEVLEEVRMRDEKDRTRKVSPLKKAEDAVLIDTTEKTIDQVVDEIEKLFYDRLMKDIV